MDALGWDRPDIVFVTGDAYVDHPSFAMALLGRLLEAEGYRVAILSQPDWKSAGAWRDLGRPRLFFAVSAGNMDSMISLPSPKGGFPLGPYTIANPRRTDRAREAECAPQRRYRRCQK